MAKQKLHEVRIKEKEGDIISLGVLKKNKRNELHKQVIHNSSGTGAHGNNKYSRKEKHKTKY